MKASKEEEDKPQSVQERASLWQRDGRRCHTGLYTISRKGVWWWRWTCYTNVGGGTATRRVGLAFSMHWSWSAMI